MSQSGRVSAVSSPSSLKRKRDLAEYTSSRNSQRTKLSGQDSSSSSPRHFSASGNHKQYPSPDSDESRRPEPGDIYHGAGSTSSLNSAPSSVFSHGLQSAAQNRPSSFANGLTPLIHTPDSSSSKALSPRAAHHSVEMSTTNGAHTPIAMRSSDAAQAPHSRADRPSMQLPPGKVKGYRAVWDPELDGRLKREERKRATVRTKEFGLEVRNTFHNLLSLRNITQMT